MFVAHTNLESPKGLRHDSSRRSRLGLSPARGLLSLALPTRPGHLPKPHAYTQGTRTTLQCVISPEEVRHGPLLPGDFIWASPTARKMGWKHEMLVDGVAGGDGVSYSQTCKNKIQRFITRDMSAYIRPHHRVF